MSDSSSPWARPVPATVTAAGPAAEPAPDLTPSRPVYDGRLGELYAIYLRHLVLMLVTLGWSRFWGRTRIRRYLWNHFAILGDRFEYRGRGIELLIGFLLVLGVLAVLAGAMYLVWVHLLDERPFSSFGVFDAFSLSILVLGFPLAYVGHYAGLRYRLTRTRWRGIRCGLAGSAWRYGMLATFLTVANGMVAQLLTPVVSVNLARPRISNVRFGTLPFAFAGHAGDIYGRYIGYYFLNILAWIVAAGVLFAAIGGTFGGLGLTEEELGTLFSQPGLRTVLVILAAAIGVYLLFSLLILPLRCWWQAYLFRYLVARSRAGGVLFATAITTRQMWGFLVLNYLIVVLTLGLGWPWVLHRTLKLIAAELWLYGAPDGPAIGQPGDRGPRFGEGLLDMFDVSGI
ncbi:YjgN family protein [Reyranella sp.]|uniref:YjgN family protein n=1 Tax=Reyranella sp. TaxID=1929291 RepID=UPI003BAAAAFF